MSTAEKIQGLAWILLISCLIISRLPGIREGSTE